MFPPFSRRSFLIRVALIVGSAFVVSPRTASAFAHDWHITEVYSNADGSVQFVELATQSPNETVLSLVMLSETELGHSFSPGHDLTGSTAGHSLLLATPGFASLPGAVQPDFIIPSVFFKANGDTIQWLTGFDGGPYIGGTTVWDSFSFASGELPMNGTSSLNRALGGASLFVAANSPTNFAGQTGSLVPEPTPALLLALALGGFAARAPAWRRLRTRCRSGKSRQRAERSLPTR